MHRRDHRVAVAGSWCNIHLRRLTSGRSAKINIRSLAQGSINFETSHKQFPGYILDFGTFTKPTNVDSPPIRQRKIGTWAVAILPYIDQQAVYEHWTHDRYSLIYDGDSNQTPSSGASGVGFTSYAAANISTFRCPSNERDYKITHGANSYVANTGFYHRSKPSVSFATSLTSDNGIFNSQFAGLDKSGQPVAVGPKVTMGDIKDGLSCTLLFTENVQAMPWHRAGFIDAGDLIVPAGAEEIAFNETSRHTQGVVWHYEHSDQLDGAATVKPVHRINGVPAGTKLEELAMTPSNCADLARPSSFHEGGVNAAMADGSTKFISATIDYRVYQALLCPRDAESEVPDKSFRMSDEI